MALDSKGKLFVTEFSRGLAVIDRSGSWLPSVALTAVICPRGVAVDEDDNIYFTDEAVNIHGRF